MHNFYTLILYCIYFIFEIQLCFMVGIARVISIHDNDNIFVFSFSFNLVLLFVS